jgi:uncharacterized membrane protein
MSKVGARLLGHQIHPMLIVFPLGLLPTAVLFDILYLATHHSQWARVSFFILPVGILMGLVAALFGLIDWLGIPRGTRARRVGAVHGLGNVVVVGLFAVSWLLRRPQSDAPTTEAIVLGIAGVLLSLITAWLGGELVERLGVGVAPGANVNAPSSLSHHSPEDARTHHRPAGA